MNSAEVLWEVIIAKWEFWQRVSKQLFMQKFRLRFKRGKLFLFFWRTFALCHGGNMYFGTPFYQRRFPVPLQEQKSGAAGSR